ncbi:hypothetical protein CYMTET_20293 [Cymbomonas tetramitiformis]|uniref:Uncharacterized protein n=1 Tax=Cymbomonas tetramitiformis TaxID=36881 RepID=A0AAE0G505_9CHLO|nr:hypothetical protein CYMTET_20293 [Cymbomonas tetramitiformis]
MAYPTCLGIILLLAVTNVAVPAYSYSDGTAKRISTTCDTYPYTNYFTECDDTCASHYDVSGGTLTPRCCSGVYEVTSGSILDVDPCNTDARSGGDNTANAEQAIMISFFCYLAVFGRVLRYLLELS